MKSTDVTRVVFRTWKDGQVIALFPDVPGSDRDPRYSCSSYEHVGQHGDADYSHVIAATRPATPAEYNALAYELESAPFEYNLRPVKRR